MLDDAISAQLLRGFTDLTKEVAGLKGVILTRMDDTERRVGELEKGMSALVGDTIAQEAMTPKAFDELARLEKACHDRHSRLNDLLTNMEKAETIEQLERARGTGRREQTERIIAKVMIGLGVIWALFLTAWQEWPPKWWPNR